MLKPILKINERILTSRVIQVKTCNLITMSISSFTAYIFSYLEKCNSFQEEQQKLVDEATIIDYVFNKNNSVNVDNWVVEKRTTFLTANGTLENKPKR